MGFSHKSHGKRSEKETQSPLTKVFKDIMHKEKHDPEKTNLLKDKHVERKRKHYSGSRSKSGHKTLDSSSSDRQKHDHPYKSEHQEMRNTEFDACRTQSVPFQGEKRESWWFWGEKGEDPEPKSKAESTCSCVSCALKKIISTEYACIGCLTILFVISGIVAVMLIYRSVPCSSGDHSGKGYDKSKFPKIEDRWKRKIDGGGWNFEAKNSWSNPFSRSQAPSFGSFKFQDMSLVESENDLAKILDVDKMNEIQNSDQLKDFYRKLIKTDAAIRNLRKSLNENSYTNTDRYNVNDFDLNNQNDLNNQIDLNGQIDIINNIDLSNNPGRIKRSLKLFHRPKLFHFKKRDRSTKPVIEKRKVVTKTTVTMSPAKIKNKSSRNKRYSFNDTEGFVIEKNQVLIQYNPSPNRIVAKCSHAPKDSNSHETRLKHPFYKNTQRLDELLDQFIDKRLPDLISDNFELNTMPDSKKKCKHPQTEELVVVHNGDQNPPRDKQVRVDVSPEKNKVKEGTKAENKENIKAENDSFESDFLDDSEGVDKTDKKERSSSSTTSSYDILLSISTIINPAVKRTTNFPASVLADRVPNLRKLMQADVKEDQGVGYEDFKEVLADEKEGHDDNDDKNYRKKRNDESRANTLDPEMKHLPTGVHNPNWKGPMPLYPEELNQMIKQGPYTDNKVEIPVHNIDSAPETDELELGLTDVQYIEDYLENGYEKLVKLAQAYSDYGVLDGKKDADAEKKADDRGDHRLDDRRVRMSMNGFKHGFKHGLHKNGIFERLKKGTDTAEGIRIEFHPTTSARDDSASDLYRLLHKHVKITNMPHGGKTNRISSFIPTPSTAHLNELHIETRKFSDDDKVKIEKNLDPVDNGIVFTVNKKRTLKSIDFKNNLDGLNDDTTEMADVFGNFEFVMSKFKRDTHNSLRNESKQANETKAFNIVNIDDITLKRKAENVTNGNDILKQKYAKNNNMTLSDFFMHLSNWFSALDTAQVTTKKTLVSGFEPRSNNVVLAKRQSNDNNNVTTELSLPLYDSDMIENIGHRSRALLSVDENNNTKETQNNVEAEDEEDHVESFSSTEPVNNMNNTKAIEDATQSMTKEKTNENNTKNRIVKRQATDDSNLIFWNDLYDDEYGIKADPLENNLRDKHSVNKNDDFLKKSNSWIQDKVKTITDKFNNMGYFRKDGKRISREATRDKNEGVNRITRSLEDEEESGSESKVDFAALTAKMKEVCKKTAKIVQQTKNVQVREENKEDHVASSLMQQLVRLMTDLVDFQVQERTCRKLPPDLQDFLEWLTSSKAHEETDSGPYSPETRGFEQHGVFFDKSTEHEQDLLQPSERENTDSRTDCLGTLHVVQDLIQQYDNMSDDDKSIMPGVKTYLVNQMDYLQRQISSIDEQNFRDSRFRRGVVTEVGHKISHAIDVTAKTVEHEYKNLKHMYHKYMDKMKHASKQVAKTTASVKETVNTAREKISQVIKPKHQHKKIHKTKDKPKEKNVVCSVDKIKINHKNNHSHQKGQNNFKDKHVKDKDQAIYKFHQKNHKDHVKDKDSLSNEDKAKDLKSKDKLDHSKSRDERNIKDVYFKAVEEAKKGTTLKNIHKSDGDSFEKAELLRIDD